MPGFLDDYEPVEDRIRAFWEDHPKGRITTEMLEHLNDHYIVRASVWRDPTGPLQVLKLPARARPEEMKRASDEWQRAAAEDRPLIVDGGVSIEHIATPPDTTGLAHESVALLPANMKASALEVCETSAIGRALANLGYAPKGKRPSREEMSARQEPSTSPPSDGAAPVGADMPGAAPTSSGGEGPSLGEGEDLNPPATSDAVTSLWNQLDQFAGSRAKAINAINKVCKSKWTRGNQQFIPLDDLESTLRYLLKTEGVA